MSAISSHFYESVFPVSGYHAFSAAGGRTEDDQDGPYQASTSSYFGPATPLRSPEFQPIVGPAIPPGGVVGEHVDLLA